MKLLHKIANNLVIIHFAKGSAGCLVHRIIGHDKSFYWHRYYNNFNSTDSLVFPMIDLKEDPSAISTCHVSHSQLTAIEQKIVKILILKALKNNKKTILREHYYDVKYVPDNIKIIRVVGDKKKLSRTILEKTHNHKLPNSYFKPIIKHNVYNLNINNLTSIDYDVFKKEYLALCADLKLTPDVKPVRNFILEWVSRQQ